MREAQMNIKRIGLDVAKHVFEICGVDENEHVVLRKTVRRNKLRSTFAQLPPCWVGLEACGSAHYWARELRKLGHEPRLMAPQFVTPYRKNEKTDRNDAEAICEAVGRANMRFVPVKDAAQQAVLTVHRARALLVSERTALVNHIRGLLSEYGVVVAQGVATLRKALPEILQDAENGVPALAREVFAELYERLQGLDERLRAYDHRIAQLARSSEAAQRLMQLEGVGPLTATAIVATVDTGKHFRNGRQFAAWLGQWPGSAPRAVRHVMGASPNAVMLSSHAVGPRRAGADAPSRGASRSQEPLGAGVQGATRIQQGGRRLGGQACPYSVGVAGAWQHLSADDGLSFRRAWRSDN